LLLLWLWFSCCFVKIIFDVVAVVVIALVIIVVFVLLLLLFLLLFLLFRVFFVFETVMLPGTWDCVGTFSTS